MARVRPSRKPDLTESLIVLLLSAATTMFVFWIASVQLGQEKFEVPAIFKSVWTSVATGGVGVAGAIVKRFLSSRGDYPNYLLYIGVTTGLMLIPIAAIIYEGEHHAAIKIPNGSHLIVTDGKNFAFTLNDARPDPGLALRVALSGSYKVEGQQLTGRLTSGTIKTSGTPTGPVHVNKIVFRSCSFNLIGNYISYYPPSPITSSIIDVDLTISPSENLVVSPGVFSFQLPDKAMLDQSFLCATLMGDAGYIYELF